MKSNNVLVQFDDLHFVVYNQQTKMNQIITALASSPEVLLFVCFHCNSQSFLPHTSVSTEPWRPKEEMDDAFVMGPKSARPLYLRITGGMVDPASLSREAICGGNESY